MFEWNAYLVYHESQISAKRENPYNPTERPALEQSVLENYLIQIWAKTDTYWTYHYSIHKFHSYLMYFLHSMPHLQTLFLSDTLLYLLWKPYITQAKTHRLTVQTRLHTPDVTRTFVLCAFDSERVCQTLLQNQHTMYLKFSLYCKIYIWNFYNFKLNWS